jgi:tRNA (cytidine/uridine-2'-O-)-methyltransferase
MGLLLSSHRLKIALLQPQIAPNTGNIARLCVASACELHLVRPMGFVLSDRQVRRSAMDYWHRLRLTVHDDEERFFGHVGGERFWLFSSKGTAGLWETRFSDGDWLIFGSETGGIGDGLLTRHGSRVVRIPHAPAERCLNLSTAAGIALYEALRQVSTSASGGGPTPSAPPAPRG